MPKRTLLVAFSVLLLFTLAANANTLTVNLYLNSPSSGYLPGNATSYTFGGSPGIVATGWSYTGGTWSQASLWNRDQAAPEKGIGVCDTSESNCAGDGNQNELSNEKLPELIGLTLPSGYKWVSFTLGSLDTNSGTATERGVLMTSNGSNPNTNTRTTLCEFASGGTVGSGDPCSLGSSAAPDLTITSGQNSPFMFFKAFDWLHGTNTNNDYLVGSATITTAPEPGSFSLLAAGLAGVLCSFRRRFSA